MKWLYKLLLPLLFISVSIAQEITPQVELFFITEGVPDTPINNCTLTAQSPCWSKIIRIGPPQDGDYYLTDDYNEQTYEPAHNNMGEGSGGFHFVTSDQGEYPSFAYGLYKVTSNGTNKYFYLDYRDYRIGYYEYFNPPTEGHNIDLWIKYRKDSDRFEYNIYGYNIGDYTPINNGQLLNFWDIKQKGNPLTNYFTDYWQNCLVLIPSPDNHPRLVWGSYPESVDIADYNIYRKVGSGSYSLIHTNTDTEFDYVDTEFTMLRQGYVALSYYVIKLKV